MTAATSASTPTRAARGVICLAAVAGIVSALVVLGAPTWVWPPAVAVALGVLAHLWTGVVRRHPSDQGPIDRVPVHRRDAVVAAVALVALATTLAGASLRPTRDDAGPDPTLLGAARSTMTALFDFGPADFAADPATRRAARITPLLTGRLLADYRSQGPNVALASAVETGASSSIAVTGVGVAPAATTGGETMRLLVFATQTIDIPTASPSRATVPIARWVVMRRVGDGWRMADLYPVGVDG
ncbi:hypothetical protein OG579_07550 [Williamsia herbipolensis]|uniref:Mce-associated membrane protein n=1 Tax=Williamsia herbipolensis TaxID=1603258 RepID=A0AAU4K6D1_9NOCA|nr:hypothetical protein [Williamsia herbipolensis]